MKRFLVALMCSVLALSTTSVAAAQSPRRNVRLVPPPARSTLTVPVFVPKSLFAPNAVYRECRLPWGDVDNEPNAYPCSRMGEVEITSSSQIQDKMIDSGYGQKVWPCLVASGCKLTTSGTFKTTGTLTASIVIPIGRVESHLGVEINDERSYTLTNEVTIQYKHYGKLWPWVRAQRYQFNEKQVEYSCNKSAALPAREVCEEFGTWYGSGTAVVPEHAIEWEVWENTVPKSPL